MQNFRTDQKKVYYFQVGRSKSLRDDLDKLPGVHADPQSIPAAILFTVVSAIPLPAAYTTVVSPAAPHRTVRP